LSLLNVPAGWRTQPFFCGRSSCTPALSEGNAGAASGARLGAFELKAATMKKHWILVAYGSMARFFTRASVGEPLVALETFDFPEERLKGSELEREHHGRGRNDNISTVVHFEPHTSTRKKLLQQFARELA